MAYIYLMGNDHDNQIKLSFETMGKSDGDRIHFTSEIKQMDKSDGNRIKLVSKTNG